MPARPRHCNGHSTPARFSHWSLATGKASGAARSQETTRARSRTKTLEGGVLIASTPAVAVATACALAVFAAACRDAPVVGARIGRDARDGGPTAAPASLTAGGAPSSAVEPLDGFGDSVAVAARAGRRADARVVSLNPATTELAFALGAEGRLVGRSRWDGWPAAANRLPALGDGLRPNVEAVLAARPTLVLLYAAEENRAAAAALRRAGVATYALRVDRLADFRRLARDLGHILDADVAAGHVVDSVDATLARVRAAVREAPRVRVAWPLWYAPLLVVGGGSYLDELLTIAGGANVFGDLAAPSPAVALEQVARRDPDVLLVGPLGARRVRDDAGWTAVRAVRTGAIRVVDTAVTGRPSLNVGMAAVSLARQLHPDRTAALR